MANLLSCALEAYLLTYLLIQLVMPETIAAQYGQRTAALYVLWYGGDPGGRS